MTVDILNLLDVVLIIYFKVLRASIKTIKFVVNNFEVMALELPLICMK